MVDKVSTKNYNIESLDNLLDNLKNLLEPLKEISLVNSNINNISNNITENFDNLKNDLTNILKKELRIIKDLDENFDDLKEKIDNVSSKICSINVQSLGDKENLEKTKLFDEKIHNSNINSLEKLNKNSDELKNLTKTTECSENIDISKNKNKNLIAERDLKNLSLNRISTKNYSNKNNKDDSNDTTKKKNIIFPAVIGLFMAGSIYYNFGEKINKEINMFSVETDNIAESQNDIKKSESNSISNVIESKINIEKDNSNKINPNEKIVIENNYNENMAIEKSSNEKIDIENLEIEQQTSLDGPAQPIQEINGNEVEAITISNNDNSLDEIYDEDADDDRPPSIDKGAKSK